MGLPLVGCASHRLNLAIQQYISEHEALLCQVNELMTQLRTKKNSASLGEYTDLRPVKRNVTRWSSTFKMVKRFVEFKDAVKHVEAVDELMPRAPDCRKLEKLLEDLKALDSECLALQSNKTTLSDVRIMFDGVIKRYPNMAKYLSQDANIVHSPAFESAVVKIMHQERLSRLETAAIASFQVGESSASEPEEANASSFAATLLHAGNKRNYPTANAPQYDSLLFHVPPTNNDCERLFSKATSK
ncbi:hypothetical protein F442_04153 [Phytophthora nicotianae P10297]|uniref:HAT C-terminal dimerisation domain-containing protein n=1 Tax=Phytophthora nicotianae P10297 TaxID=1317064 RepID=W2ZU71_PHYNI|nr:hypothetical protein F442_04153 [Phytophthora nicotianae P10297]